ncbi:O-antigen ligase family protein [Streptacidiphilus sp. N1-3]|uniref:O-antigen ligase family protein n=1 Tax=Streptacidiphilus alkalitolerans TaxID=3342712 RepID=A0ABV6X765_9ACTN
MKAVGRSPSEPISVVPHGTESSAADVIGALLLAGCATWTLYTAAGRDTHPEGVLLGLLAVAAGYAGGRVAGAVVPVGAPAVVALAVGAFALLVPGGLSGDPAALPLHDMDADGALLALAVGAACCAAHAAHAAHAEHVVSAAHAASAVSVARGEGRGQGRRQGRGRGWNRLLLGGLALGITAEALATGSVAGLLACGAALVVAGSATFARRRVPVLVLLALCAGLAAGAPLLLARPSGPPGVLSSATPLADQREALWHDAVHEAAGAPLRGVGPGRFAELSPAAQESATPGGASSAVLQAAAEQGIPGVCLLAGSFGWMLWTLRRSPGPTAVVLTAAGALTALAAEAAVSPVLSYPGITAGAGLLVGMATARPLSQPQLQAQLDDAPS